MKCGLAVGALLAGAVSSFAAPTPASRNLDSPRAVTGTFSDTQVLQYLLASKQLQSAFYRTHLDRFSASDFEAAGYASSVYDALSQVSQHELYHISLLTSVLLDVAPTECSYTFPVKDVASFVDLAEIIESVGVSTYLGAVSSIKNPTYITLASAIMGVDAKHASWINAISATASGRDAAAAAVSSVAEGGYDTPLDFNEAYTIMSAMTTSCPETNPLIGLKAFAQLDIAADGTIRTTATYRDSQVQVLVVSGLSPTMLPVQNGRVDIPRYSGVYYALLTTASSLEEVSDDNIIAGPAILRAKVQPGSVQPGTSQDEQDDCDLA